MLKDAAANALYGARGANGVILVTTKSGKTGEAQVTFDAKIGHESRAVSNYDVIKSPATYMEKAYEAIYNSGIGQGLTAEQANKYANKILPTSGDGGVGYTIFTVPRSILKQLLVTRTVTTPICRTTGMMRFTTRAMSVRSTTLLFPARARRSATSHLPVTSTTRVS